MTVLALQLFVGNVGQQLQPPVLLVIEVAFAGSLEVMGGRKRHVVDAGRGPGPSQADQGGDQDDGSRDFHEILQTTLEVYAVTVG
jgi:hypothetical protein